MPDATPSASSAVRRAILLVEDEPAVRALVRAALAIRHDGYDLAEASTGLDALEQALACRPDLILLDVGLPGRDGFSVCGDLKQHPATAHVPIIMLTAMNQPADWQRATQAGADGYMAKPFSPRALLAMLDETLGASPAR